MEKKNFKTELWASKKGLTPLCEMNWYGLTDDEIKATARGIAIGMGLKYAHPLVIVYEVKESGEKLAIYKCE